LPGRSRRSRIRRRRRLSFCRCGAYRRTASRCTRNPATGTASGGGDQKRALAAGTVGVCTVSGEASSRFELYVSGTPAKNKRRNRGIIRSLAYLGIWDNCSSSNTSMTHGDDRARQHTPRASWRLKKKSRRGIRAPRRLVVDSLPLSHPEGIECRLVDHRRRGEPLFGLVGGERLSGHRPEQSIHLTLVIAHLLQHGLHVRDHLIRRLSAVTHIDRCIVGIIFGRRIVTPCRIPVTVVPIVVTATDQLHAVVTRPIPTLIVPFRMIRAEYVVLRTLPLIASLNPIVLIVGNRRNLLRLWLRTKVRVLRLDLLSLRLDLLHLLRVRFLRRGRRTSRRVLRAGCRNCGSCAYGCRRRCRSSS